MTISLIDALKLILNFADSQPVVNVIRQAIEELERLYRLEASLEKTQGEAVEADWQAANQMAKK